MEKDATMQNTRNMRTETLEMSNVNFDWVKAFTLLGIFFCALFLLIFAVSFKFETVNFLTSSVGDWKLENKLTSDFVGGTMQFKITCEDGDQFGTWNLELRFMGKLFQPPAGVGSPCDLNHDGDWTKTVEKLSAVVNDLLADTSLPVIIKNILSRAIAQSAISSIKFLAGVL